MTLLSSALDIAQVSTLLGSALDQSTDFTGANFLIPLAQQADGQWVYEPPNSLSSNPCPSHARLFSWVPAWRDSVSSDGGSVIMRRGSPFPKWA